MATFVRYKDLNVNPDTGQALNQDRTLSYMMGIDAMNGTLSYVNEWEFICQRFPPTFDDNLDGPTKEGKRKATWLSNSTGQSRPFVVNAD